MFDMKLNSQKLGVHQIESAFSLVGGTQPKNHAARCDLDRRHVKFTKILQKRLRMIRSRCSTTWIHNVQLPQTRGRTVYGVHNKTILDVVYGSGRSVE